MKKFLLSFKLKGRRGAGQQKEELCRGSGLGYIRRHMEAGLCIPSPKYGCQHAGEVLDEARKRGSLVECATAMVCSLNQRVTELFIEGGINMMLLAL